MVDILFDRIIINLLDEKWGSEVIKKYKIKLVEKNMRTAIIKKIP